MTRRSAAELGEQGIRNAIERLAEALDEGEAVDPRLPFNEALFWGYALREFHKNRLGNDFYYRSSRNSREGSLTEAVMYARGFVTHELVNVMDARVILGSEPGSMIPGRSQLGASTRTEYRWVSLPENAKPDPHGRDQIYRTGIADQVLMPVLETMASFLLALRSRERV